MEPMTCAVTASLGALLLLRATLIERSEIIFWRLPWTPLAVLVVAWMLGLLVHFLARKQPLRPQTNDCRLGRTELTKRWWSIAFACALSLCFFLRAWQIDYQPPGDDEYASIQASLAISEKGVPELTNHVWYTRSPLYHYLAGTVLKLTNGGLYSLRLLSVVFACASCALLGRWVRELTSSRLLAFSAMLLYALHPYLIFTGHIRPFLSAAAAAVL